MSSTVKARLGVGLWTMQSTHDAPRPFPELYRRFGEDAALADSLGLDSLWLSEHRAWYDGWCPALLPAQAHAAACTSRLRLGSAVLLAPQHQLEGLIDGVVTLQRLSGGRLELGLGLGYREAEFEAVGASRAHRGRRMDGFLERLEDVAAPAPVWVGGISQPAVRRAARFGHGLLLPQSTSPDSALRLVDLYAGEAGRPPRIAVLRDVWLEDDDRRAATFRARLRRHYAEEVGSWWKLGEATGFAAPAAVEEQLDRMERSAVVGSVEAVLEALMPWIELGAELVVARVNFDFVEQGALHERMARLAENVMPALGGDRQ